MCAVWQIGHSRTVRETVCHEMVKWRIILLGGVRSGSEDAFSLYLQEVCGQSAILRLYKRKIKWDINLGDL